MSSAAALLDDKSAAPGKGKRGKMLILLPLVLVAVGAGLWFGGVLPPLLGMGKPAAAPTEAAAPRPPVFVDVPELVANLNANGRKTAFVKLKAKIELERAEDQPTLAADMPRVMDLFQTYLREMRPEELRGAAGTYRLREELLARANIACAPLHIVDILFVELLTQ